MKVKLSSSKRWRHTGQAEV